MNKLAHLYNQEPSAPTLSFPGYSRISFLSAGDWIRVRFGLFFKSNITIVAKLNFKDLFQKKTFSPEKTKNESKRLNRFALRAARGAQHYEDRIRFIRFSHYLKMGARLSLFPTGERGFLNFVCNLELVIWNLPLGGCAPV